MTKGIPKMETAHGTIKQEKLTCPKYKLEDNKLQGYEGHDRLKVKKGHKTKTKQHGCPECGKHFSKEGNLKSHQVIHTGEQPYSCDQCDRCFARLIALKIHKLPFLQPVLLCLNKSESTHPHPYNNSTKERN